MQISPLETYFIDQGREYRRYDILTKTWKNNGGSKSSIYDVSVLTNF